MPREEGVVRWMRHRPLIDGLHAFHVTAKRVSISTLALEQPLLSFHSPAVAAQRTIGANDAVTWDQDGNPIRGARPRHGASGARTAKCRRDLSVRISVPWRNSSQHGPDPLLKASAQDIQRHLHVFSSLADVRDDCSDPIAVRLIAWRDLRVRKIAAQTVHQRVIGLTERDGANATLRRSNEESAER